MLTVIYQALLAVVVVLILVELFTQKKLLAQMTAAFTLIPFALRLFMIA